ncbi:hypothetical protein GCM10023340_26940 [Nocardioides marinquilinus]|uniref:Uncharacterized protein n=1 Tax=Nocardioides marinquilinus TaxID=1210400 RepID=A0ABP9PQ16_9ACTN
MAEKSTDEPGTKPAGDTTSAGETTSTGTSSGTSGTSGKTTTTKKADGETTGASGSTKTTEVHTEKRAKRSPVKVDLKKIRTAIARLLWTVCLVFAFVLAASVLLIAIDANRQNELVDFLFKFADRVDLGFFDLTSPIKDFDSKKGQYQDTKTALFNYGIAAVVWLVIGRIVDRVVRP